MARAGRTGVLQPALDGIHYMKGIVRPDTEGTTVQRDPAQLRQIAYFREQVHPEFEIERPAGAGRLYEYLLRYKFGAAVGMLPFPLTGRQVLNVCCGSGMDVEFMAEAGASVIGLDLSRDAVGRARERSRRHGFRAHFVVGDAERLPFRNDAVAVGFVHDGLHHLSDPHRAVRELARVTRDAVLLVEPANAAVTRVAVRLGISGEYEDAGNYVYRLSKPELVSLFHSLRMRSVKIRRYLMYYHHEPKRYYRVFEHAVPFRLLQFLFFATNAVVGRWGNKLMCLALKRGPESEG